MAFGSSIAQRHDFSMWAASLLGMTKTQGPSVGRYDHAADGRVGSGQGKGVRGLFQRVAHAHEPVQSAASSVKIMLPSLC